MDTANLAYVSSHAQPARLPPRIRMASPSSVRAVNRSIVLELIRRRQPVSRADLARLTGIFRSSVSDIVDELVAEELVAEERAVSSKRGRVPISLRLNDSGYSVLGLNIRPHHCQIAYAGLSGQIQQTWTFRTPSSPDQLVHGVSKTIKRIREDLGMPPSQTFRKMGISIPGHVDAPTGRILWTPTHEELANFPITEEILRQTGIPALADNDCNAGALSELWLARDKKNHRSNDFVFLNVSDFGTGAGVVINGQIYAGHNAHFAAEFGHMVVEPDGLPCRCGRRGCWERYVSNSETWRRFRPRAPFTAENFGQMLSSARTGDKQALECLRESARYLAMGIANIGVAYNPSEIVVAGRITEVWDLIAKEIEERYRSPYFRQTVRPARLSADDSLLHGAVCLSLQATFAAPRFGET
jgi:predicted NBD/HSP70 family sugar kinase